MSEPTPAERIELAINALQGFASGYMRDNNAFDSSRVIADSAREALATLTAQLEVAQRYRVAMERHLCPHDLVDWLACDYDHPRGECEACVEADLDGRHRHALLAEITALRKALAKARWGKPTGEIHTCPVCGPECAC